MGAILNEVSGAVEPEIASDAQSGVSAIPAHELPAWRGETPRSSAALVEARRRRQCAPATCHDTAGDERNGGIETHRARRRGLDLSPTIVDGPCRSCFRAKISLFLLSGSRRRLQVHQRVPLRDGGSNELDNLELLCPRCHGRAGQCG